ncbi:protoheme IX farnesyltransferase [Verruconis gallopava]|uniref:Protoheme IX farnesyltransferase, mitochondrial n=1 Tax=Verruconis gallopava TaxID=253628 RepID=A0A0D2AJY6_9PEZI|nr:protoheme IX farnesyltransferase [Verruconis gallopava]KIW07173.1 protoheme IX farnesyltransferase [Verruconis gallopava]
MLHPGILSRRIISPGVETICSRCLSRLSRLPLHGSRGLATSTRHRQDSSLAARGYLFRDYFSANGIEKELPRGSRSRYGGRTTREQSTASLQASDSRTESTEGSEATSKSDTPIALNSQREELPHRKRRRRHDHDQSGEPAIPLDASNRLTTLSSNMPANSFRRLFTTYLSLSKPRLSFLIVLTTTAAYSVYPVPTLLETATTAAPSLSTLTLAFLTTGTFLTCASANTLNMMAEPEHDAKMSRTRNRPLVRKLITQRGALLFAIATGITGTVALWFGVNPTTATLAAANIFLYAGVYTPMKRISVANTWVGAVVGAIPPLMGWTAAAGQTATGPGDWRELLLGERSAGGWLMAALLFCWQFPHFNALSWGIREEYKNAGYRMLAWTNPARNARVALRYSVLMLPVCLGLAYAGVVEKAFIPISTAINGWVIYEAVRFWKHEGKKGTARALFWASVWHLPLILVSSMILKKGLLERSWSALTGKSIDEEEWEELNIISDDEEP